KCTGIETNPHLPEGTRGYTPMWNAVFSHWWGYPPELEPSPAAKMTYLHLTSLGGESRYLWARIAAHAQRMRLPLKTLMNHLRELQQAGLLLLVPKSHVIAGNFSRWKTILLLDLPAGFGAEVDLLKLADLLRRLGILVGVKLERPACQALLAI